VDKYDLSTRIIPGQKAFSLFTRRSNHRPIHGFRLRDSGGTGLWHETYLMGGGMEAIYDDMNRPIGLARFAPVRPARGAMFAARRRAGRSEPSTVEPVITEAEYYPG
jgi:Domain of unknown function (DUF4188)